jgi:hypothetical protein
VQVYCFYNYKWASYTLTDSFFNAPVANDVEPNSSKSQAVNLTLGSTNTGHVGYYYNLKRDTTDCTKLLLPKMGRSILTLPQTTGNMFTRPCDNDGTTVLKTGYSNGTIITNTDGLAAEPNYLSIYCFYNYKWAPYTLTNSLSEYTNANDGLNNDISKRKQPP